MITTVYAESRRGSKSVLLERIRDVEENPYRLTIVYRFPTLAKAQDAMLSNTPPSHKDNILKQIADAKRFKAACKRTQDKPF